MITVTRRHSFEYAHRVLGHLGRCRHLHGHGGVVEITIGADELDDSGMVVDFSIIKSVLCKWIDDNLDHQILLNAEDPQLLHLQRTEEKKPFVMPNGNPTAENMAKLIYEKCRELISSSLQVVRIRLYETPGCYADYPG